MFDETKVQFQPPHTQQQSIDASAFYANLSSTISLNGTLANIPAPPLSLGNLGIPLDPNNNSTLPSFKRCYNNVQLPEDFTPIIYCVSTNDKYSFGISKSLSVGILITQGVWCLMTWVVWYYVVKSSLMGGRGKGDGPFRSALILTKAMESELGSDLHQHSEKSLREQLARKEGIGLSGAKSETKNGIVGFRHRK